MDAGADPSNVAQVKQAIRRLRSELGRPGEEPELGDEPAPPPPPVSEGPSLVPLFVAGGVAVVSVGGMLWASAARATHR